MPRLSWPIENIKRRYDVVVVGSGYGASIAAARLAEAGRQVCVLERGREWQPGEYPDTLREAWSQAQVDHPRHHIGHRTALYDLRLNDDIDVFLGCGLGGTSLVNANVSLRPDPRVFGDERWPRQIRDNPATLDQGFGLAEGMLRPAPYPDDYPPLPKLAALGRSAEHLGQKGFSERFYRPPINVHFGSAGPNHVGVYQRPCVLCGDCVSGCNYSSKNTLIMNYLPYAKSHGAEIFTRTWVHHLERRDGRWLVKFQVLDSGREAFDAPTLFIVADNVVLGAGALGSTEILLRSKLDQSDMVGQRFTGNGDVLAFAYNTGVRIDGIGFGDHPVGKRDPVGPCITGIIDMRDTTVLEDGMVIEEGSIPGALSGFLPEIMAQLAALIGKDTDPGLLNFVHEKARELGGLFRGRHSGALDNTQTYLVMSHDDGAGRMELVDDRLRIKWPDVGGQELFRRINDRLREASVALGGDYVENPLWTRLFQHDLVTVHPLGGCVMADDAAHGVVNDKCQVYSGRAGSEVYENLFVCDGSVVPRPLGVNPLLTISALSERAMDHMVRSGTRPVEVRTEAAAVSGGKMTLGIQFTETMRGYLSTKEREDYDRAEQEGMDAAKERARTGVTRKDAGSFEFTLTIISEDLERTITDQRYDARTTGTATSPPLSPEPLMVTDGRFNLFVDDPGDPRRKRMWYRMHLSDVDGKLMYFEGFKDIHDDPGVDIWRDTTTLYITLFDGQDDRAPVMAKGILRIRPRDFARQLTTMQAMNASSVKEALEAKAKFGAYFARSLHEVYGALLV